MSSKQCASCKLVMINNAYEKMQSSGKCPNCDYPWRCNCIYEKDMLGQVPVGSYCPFCQRPRHENLMDIGDIEPNRSLPPEFNSLDEEATEMRRRWEEAKEEAERWKNAFKHIQDFGSTMVDSYTELVLTLLEQRDEARKLAAKYYLYYTEIVGVDKSE